MRAIGRQALACFVRGGKMVARAGHPAGCCRGGRGCAQVSIVYGVGRQLHNETCNCAQPRPVAAGECLQGPG